jgi:hypothetical protein
LKNIYNYSNKQFSLIKKTKIILINMNTRERLLAFLLSRKGESSDMTDKIIGLVIAGLILFSLFGSLYSSYISANGTAGMTSTHSVMLGLIVTMLVISFLLMIWRSAKGR